MTWLLWYIRYVCATGSVQQKCGGGGRGGAGWCSCSCQLPQRRDATLHTFTHTWKRVGHHPTQASLSLVRTLILCYLRSLVVPHLFCFWLWNHRRVATPSTKWGERWRQCFLVYFLHHTVVRAGFWKIRGTQWKIRRCVFLSLIQMFYVYLSLYLSESTCCFIDIFCCKPK